MKHAIPFVFSLALVTILGCDPPSGPNLAELSCVCDDEASGSTIILPARVCTDLSDPDKAMDDAQSQCDTKETICFPDCYGIENCGVHLAPVGIGMCPNNSSPLAGGDFGQATALAAVADISVFGDDVDDFTTSFDTLSIATTQNGNTLEFADIAGFKGQVNFSTPGGLFGIGGGSHTLTNVRLFLKGPFSVPLNDGVFEIGEGIADFVVSAELDGDFAPLAATSKTLDGVYIEELGLFNLFGQIDPEGADVHLSVSIQFLFQNRPPRARAGADQAVECNSADGTGVANVSGAASFDLDGAADIARHTWTVNLGTDPDPQVVLGSDVAIPLALGAHVLSLAVADVRGSFGVDTVGVTVADTTAPALTVLEPEAIEYPHTAILTLDYSVDDACTGVATQVARLNGATTLAGHGLDSGQMIDLLTELPLGTHTFSLEADDVAGNSDSTSISFTIVATPESLIQAIELFAASGAVRDQGTADSLLAKARAGARSYNLGECRKARTHYTSLVRHIQNDGGRNIDPVAGAILIADAQYLMANCVPSARDADAVKDVKSISRDELEFDQAVR